MSERPIIFSEPMVQAILAGRKIQTRREVKKAPLDCKLAVMTRSSKALEKLEASFFEGETTDSYFCGSVPSRYQRGDELWVRETWNAIGRSHGPNGTYWHNSPPEARKAEVFKGFVYKAKGFRTHDPDFRWIPSIFMPRWACRLFLTVTDVRVERIQDISHADAMREGWPEATPEKIALAEATGDGDDAAIDWFAELWDTINAKRGCSWESNPWVWVVEFKRAEL